MLGTRLVGVRPLTVAALALGALAPDAGASQEASRAARAQEVLRLRDAELLHLDLPGPVAGPLAVPVRSSRFTDVLVLRPSDVRAPGYELVVQRGDGSFSLSRGRAPRTFRGELAGHPGSMASGSYSDDGLHVRIMLPGGESLWLEPLAGRVPGASAAEYVMYEGDDVLESELPCAEPALPGESTAGAGGTTSGGGSTASATGLKITELACDADYEYFTRWGSVSAVEARIHTVIDAVNLQYEAEVGITHQITSIVVRTSPSQPYTSTDSGTLLVQFKDEWNANHSGIPRDVAHLFTGKQIDGSTIGIAYLSVICNTSWAYGLSQSDFSSNFASVTDLTAHELGHNWGASHCSCTSYTMNPYITSSNTFEPSVTIPTIVGFRDSRTCLDDGTPEPPEPEDPEINHSIGESLATGTLTSGSHLSTHAQDDVYEVLTETSNGGKPTNRRSRLSHTWTFDVAPGSAYTLFVDAHHSGNLEGDDFRFSYSRDNASFVPALTVTKTSDDDSLQSYAFGEDVAGTLYVRVEDTDRTQGNGTKDSLYVDELYVHTELDGNDVTPPSAPVGLVATAGDGTVGLDWTDGAEPDLAGYDVHRSETPGGPYSKQNAALVTSSDWLDATVVNGTTYHYVVTALDLSGNVSAASLEVKTPSSSHAAGVGRRPDERPRRLHPRLDAERGRGTKARSRRRHRGRRARRPRRGRPRHRLVLGSPERDARRGVRYERCRDLPDDGRRQGRGLPDVLRRGRRPSVAELHAEHQQRDLRRELRSRVDPSVHLERGGDRGRIPRSSPRPFGRAEGTSSIARTHPSRPRSTPWQTRRSEPRPQAPKHGLRRLHPASSLELPYLTGFLLGVASTHPCTSRGGGDRGRVPRSSPRPFGRAEGTSSSARTHPYAGLEGRLAPGMSNHPASAARPWPGRVSQIVLLALLVGVVTGLGLVWAQLGAYAQHHRVLPFVLAECLVSCVLWAGAGIAAWLVVYGFAGRAFGALRSEVASLLVVAPLALGYGARLDAAVPGLLGDRDGLAQGVGLLVATVVALVVARPLRRWQEGPWSSGRRYTRGVLLLFLAPLGAQTLALSSPRSDAPDVLVLLIDILRADHLGCYGYERPTSPNIDAFAEDAILFENFVAASTYTKTSISTLFTGLPAYRHGVYHGTWGHDPDEVESDTLSRRFTTLAEALDAHGLNTAGWIQNGQIRGYMGFDQGFAYFRDRAGRIPRIAADYRAWRERWADDTRTFAYLHFIDLHAPYQPSEEYLGRFGDPQSRAEGMDDSTWHVFKRKVANGKIELSPQDVRDFENRHDEQLGYVDEWIGRILDDLKAAGRYDDTLIVVTSDHGEGFWEHGFISHSNAPYEELTHSPLLVKLPGSEHGGRRVEQMVGGIDLAPTLIELAGATPPADMEGESFLALLRDPDAELPPRQRYIEFNSMVGVRTDRWKYIARRSDEPAELYDLTRDPGERHNCIDEFPEVAAELGAAVEAAVQARMSARAAERVRVDQETVEDLQALGYM